MAAEPKATRLQKKGSSGSAAGEFYRITRMLHAYVSAFAFLILLFFSITGLTLNHPGWLGGRPPRETTRTVLIPRADLDAALTAPLPAKALAAAVARLTPLVGGNPTGDVVDGQAEIRLEGPRGSSDVTVTVATGQAEVSTRPATLVAMLNDLHKGKAAGSAWGTIIDISAVLFIALSVLGYVLFFSLRFRLPLSLVLTGISLVVLIAGAMLLVG
jgi:hypothetical protein